jgi:hypothetical protein
MDLKLGLDDVVVGLAKYMEEWRAIMITVMNIQFP